MNVVTVAGVWCGRPELIIVDSPGIVGLAHPDRKIRQMLTPFRIGRTQNESLRGTIDLKNGLLFCGTQHPVLAKCRHVFGIFVHDAGVDVERYKAPALIDILDALLEPKGRPQF